MRRLVFAVLLVAVLFAAVLLYGRRGPAVEAGSTLVVDIQGSYVEAAEPALLDRVLGDAGVPLLRLYGLLRKAERDPRIAAVVLRIRPTRFGWAKAQEIRDAVGRLRAARKKVVAYLEVEPIGANREYYVASAADAVYVSPGTRVPFVGLAAEYLFLGGLFDKAGIDIEMERVGPHKTAGDLFTARELSDAAREMGNWLLDSVEDQYLSAIVESRGVKMSDLLDAIASAATHPEDLEARGLIDGTRFFAEITDSLGGPVIEADRYAAVDPARVGFDPVARVALVYGSGNVVTGEAPRSGGPRLASVTVSKALEKAAADPEIDAILFRIDSPGGSALASDLVWNATRRAREKKPVVVSFSDVAASGGYYVACGADAIVAQPATITGSIGVILLRPVVARLYEKLEIGSDALLRGPYADIYTLSRPASPATRAWLGEEVERTYQLFLDRVVAGRGLKREAVDAAGRGRVWTGAQAADLGLVDRLGGYYAAVAVVREKLGLEPDADLSLTVYPPPKPLTAQLAEMLQGVRVGVGDGLPLALPLPDGARTLLSWLRDLPAGAPLLLPSAVIRIH